jgi:hypothetical protein
MMRVAVAGMIYQTVSLSAHWPLSKEGQVYLHLYSNLSSLAVSHVTADNRSDIVQVGGLSDRDAVEPATGHLPAL